MTATVEPVSAEDLGGKPSQGTKADKRLKSNKGKRLTPNAAEDGSEDLQRGDSGDAPQDNSMMAPETLPVMAEAAQWRGVLVVEGTPTGDGREFADGSLQWATPPLPLRWQKTDSHGGMPMNETVRVGTIQRVWRDGSNIMGEGVFDLSGPDDDDAHNAFRANQSGALTGVSIDADDITDADIEYVFPKSDGEAEEDEDNLFMLLFASPEKVIFHDARIRAATLCDIPAFVEARITAIPTEQQAAMAAAAIVFESMGAIGVHHTATDDGSWDGPANEARLDSPVSLTTAKDAYAWYDAGQVDAGELPKSACRFIHHDIGADGRPGAANLTACSTGIGVLNGGRGGTTIPSSDKRGVYNHLAGHLRDAGREPPPFQGGEEDTESLVAGLFQWQQQDWRPPRSWFNDPKLGQYVPIMVSDAGRVYGHATPWGQCHLGYMEECVMPPFEEHHEWFMTGECPTNDGTVAVGQITAGIEHAALHLSPMKAKEHYENTDAVIADVCVGNDAHGIWVAGAIRPWANASRVHSLRASGQVSPDWRSIGGLLRMVGLLTVNVSGYQVPKPTSHTLVADGQVRAMTVSGLSPLPALAASASVELDNDAIGKLERQRLRKQLAERVHGKV